MTKVYLHGFTVLGLAITFLLSLNAGLNFSINYAFIEFVVVIPSYNNELYCVRNVESVLSQKVDSPFEVIYINDCSNDATGRIVENYLANHPLGYKVKVIHNAKRIGTSLGNLYNAVHSCPDHKIIVNLDGRVLQTIASRGYGYK